MGDSHASQRTSDKKHFKYKGVEDINVQYITYSWCPNQWKTKCCFCSVWLFFLPCSKRKLPPFQKRLRDHNGTLLSCSYQRSSACWWTWKVTSNPKKACSFQAQPDMSMRFWLQIKGKIFSLAEHAIDNSSFQEVFSYTRQIVLSGMEKKKNYMHRARFVSLCFTLLGFTGVAIFFFYKLKARPSPAKML